MEREYPRYASGKNIQIKMTPQMATMGCDYHHLVRAFGQPSFSSDAGDEFDGIEKCAWHIEFETGERVRISDVRPFGMDDSVTKTKEWRVNTLSQTAYEWIKQIIRDSNPNG
jgi:hypothetical protein